jgi:hypothetical protein
MSALGVGAVVYGLLWLIGFQTASETDQLGWLVAAIVIAWRWESGR